MTFRIALVALSVLVMGSSPRAQDPPPNDPYAAARHGFSEVSGWIAKAAATVPPDKYSYRPAPSVRTFGELIAHIADWQNFFCGRAAQGKKVQWSDATEKGKHDKTALAAKLKQSVDACSAAYANNKSNISDLMANIAHDNLHYGNIITYMRMLGLTPPSS